MAEKPEGKKGEPGERIVHPIPPVFDEHSRILILGSFPSVKSRETAFFYGHPRNRFWRVLAAVYSESVPETIPEKRAFLLRTGTAVWDVIQSCEIRGSSDASIREAIPNDLGKILCVGRIGGRIFTNGAKANEMYRKYQYRDPESPCFGVEAVRLPSTSPANAAWSEERLIAAWSDAILSVL